MVGSSREIPAKLTNSRRDPAGRIKMGAAGIRTITYSHFVFGKLRLRLPPTDLLRKSMRRGLIRTITYVALRAP